MAFPQYNPFGLPYGGDAWTEGINAYTSPWFGGGSRGRFSRARQRVASLARKPVTTRGPQPKRLTGRAGERGVVLGVLPGDPPGPRYPTNVPPGYVYAGPGPDPFGPSVPPPPSGGVSVSPKAPKKKAAPAAAKKREAARDYGMQFARGRWQRG